MQKSYSRLLLLLISLLTLWRGGFALVQVWEFLRLGWQLEGQIKDCRVSELSASKYALEATCLYQFGNKEWSTTLLLPPPYFPNRYAAEEAKALQPERIALWIDPNKPSHIAFARTFPWLPCLYGGVCIGVWLYFIYIIQVSAGGERRAASRGFLAKPFPRSFLKRGKANLDE